MWGVNRYLLPAIAFLLPWQTRWIYGQATIVGEPFELGVMSFYAVELLIVIALAFSALTHYMSDRSSNVPGISVLALLLWSCLTALWALHPTLVLAQSIHLLCALSLFFLITQSKESIRPIVWMFVLGLIVPTLLGVWQVVVGDSGASTFLGLATRDAQTLGDAVLMVGGERMLRAYGSFAHPNIFGGYLVMGLVGVGYLRFMDQGRIKASDAIWLHVSGLMLFFGLVLTFSRSAWLAFVVVVIVLLVWTIVRGLRGWRAWFAAAKRVRLGLAVGILVVALLSPLIASRFSFQEAVELRSISERTQQYQEFGEVFTSNWLTGVGLANYTPAIAVLDPDRAWWEYQPVHNAWALLIAELGLVGLFIAIMIVWRLVHYTTDRSRSETVIFALAVLVPLVIISLFDHYLWSLWSGLSLVAFSSAVIIRVSRRI